MMLIRLTSAVNKLPFYMRAKDVRTVEKDSRDQITTMVTTDVFTNNGPIAYRVMESVEEVANMVNAGISLGGGSGKLLMS
jgi:hypothetical protein